MSCNTKETCKFCDGDMDDEATFEVICTSCLSDITFNVFLNDSDDGTTTCIGYRVYDAKGDHVYFEHEEGGWRKYEYDDDHNVVREESSDGEVNIYKYDEDGERIYFETSDGLCVHYDGNSIAKMYGNRKEVVVV